MIGSGNTWLLCKKADYLKFYDICDKNVLYKTLSKAAV